MFGSQILVAPLMESGNSRMVYLPKGNRRSSESHQAGLDGRVATEEDEVKWIDYQSGVVYEGGYQTIEVGKIPAVILVRDGSLIPHAPLAQRTDEIDWNAIELKAYRADANTCTGLLYKPGDKAPQVITKP